ncbi:hypothetical protein ACIJYE_03275 [Candidatus Pelagibacter bacterium nBUS_30]|uniref:hypothetical protein n=1 Tax=Candidatus Pelagibacter bacterium nBUS_30 TaxID=3374191 RepID=UPI003EB78B8F
MKFFITLLFFLFLNNCSLNKDSKYWTEDVEKRKVDQKKLTEILKKSNDITTLTQEEYQIYIDDYIKKSKYPDISQ